MAATPSASGAASAATMATVMQLVRQAEPVRYRADMVGSPVPLAGGRPALIQQRLPHPPVGIARPGGTLGTGFSFGGKRPNTPRTFRATLEVRGVARLLILHGRILDSRSAAAVGARALRPGDTGHAAPHGGCAVAAQAGAGSGIAPSCCIRPSMSIWSHSSVIFPFAMRRMDIPPTVTRFPVDAIPISSPR